MKTKSKSRIKKKPWIAAILNFLFWGGGYVYNGKQIHYGIFLVTIFLAVNFFTMKYLEYRPFVGLVYLLMLVLVSLFLAIGGYKEAKKLLR